MAFVFISAGLALAGGFFLIFLWIERPSPESVLLAQLAQQEHRPDQRNLAANRLNLERLMMPFTKIWILLSGKPGPGFAHRLTLAGYRENYHADVYMGARMMLPALVAVAAALWANGATMIWFILALAGALLLPELWLAQAIEKRRERIRLSVPDALDLLAICLEAGLGLDQAILRVGQELQMRHPDLSAELMQISLEQQAGSPRLDAWRNMAARTGVDSVNSLVNVLAQAERFGAAISKSLASFSDALRTQRRQQAEERAAKSTVKLALPLVFFIFPSIFIVTAAPAIITIFESFSRALK